MRTQRTIPSFGHTFRSILKFQARQSFRSKRTVFHGLGGFLFLATAWGIGGLAESIVEGIREEGVSGLPLVLAALSAKMKEAGRDFPALLLIYSYIAHLFVPTVALIIGANQFHGDLNSGHARLLFPRVRRTRWMLARFMWTALFWGVISSVGAGWGAWHVAEVSSSAGLPLENAVASVGFVALGAFLAGIPLLALSTLLNVSLGSNLSILIVGLACWFALGAGGQYLLGGDNLVPWSPFFFMAGDFSEWTLALTSGSGLVLFFLWLASVQLNRKELSN